MQALGKSVRRRSVGAAGALTAIILLAVSASLPLWVAAQKASKTHERRAGTVGNAASPVVLRHGQAGAIRPTWDRGRQFDDASGKPHLALSTGSVATPIDRTYSVHHLIGADVNGDGRTDCFYIAADPPPAAPDDVVTYDGLPEEIMTDIRGTIPTVVEYKTDNADGTHRLVIDTSSPPGTDLFPGGVEDEHTGELLTDACFFIGYFHPVTEITDPLDWEGMDTVLAASISFLTDGEIVIGPIDLDPSVYFPDPWNGFLGVSHADTAGLGINGVRLEILVEKTPQGPLAACCAAGECIGDIEQASCEFQGGNWYTEASCGQDPTLPPPVCAQTECSFNNGLPLDDFGTPVSQFAPDIPFSAGAADDFILKAPEDNPCRINRIRAWVTHTGSGVDPAVHYQGVNVTIYANADPKGPGGQPEDDGSHTPDFTGGIVYAQTIPMGTVTVTAWNASCARDMWQLDIPVDIVLNKNTKYWLEIQPIMDGALGGVLWALSQNNNDHSAQQIYADAGITAWEQIPGNADQCPDGTPPTPPAGTRRNLAFQLFGEKISDPPNDGCAEAIRVPDGVIPFSTVGATTDGPDEPETCDIHGYSHIESDIWYEYVATCTGELSVSLCGSGYDTKLAVYAGCERCPPRRAPLACDDDSDLCDPQSQVTVPALAGDCYTIRIGGYLGDQGKGIMTVRCEVPPPPTGACCESTTCLGTMTEAECDAENGTWYEGEDCATFICPVPRPPNDECPDCIPVETGVPFQGTTVGATGTDISTCAGLDTRDVWHCWRADCTGQAVFALCDSSYDTTLAVYDACGGNELACNDDACGLDGLQSMIAPPDMVLPGNVVPVTTDTTYYLRVSGWNVATGDYTLVVEPCANACCLPDVSCRVLPPDDCQERGGTPQDPGTICADVECRPPEACCLPNGQCEEVTRENCIGRGGVPQGPDTTCLDVECPQPEACCFPDGRCEDLTQGNCAGGGGVSLGPDTACEGDADGNGTDDACDPDQPCEDCSAGQHWIDQCTAGGDVLHSGALIEIDVNLDCRMDMILTLAGPVHIRRSVPLDDSIYSPGLRPVDSHLDVIDIEIVSMNLTGAGSSLTAGAGFGQGGVLPPSMGAIAEQLDSALLADGFFDVFFEVDLGAGQLAYNHTPLRLDSKIDCMPPNANYIHRIGCIRLYDSPNPGEGANVANLVTANYDTFVECGSSAAGDCFDNNLTPFCDNAECCERVCDTAPNCCEAVWCADCVGVALDLCPQPEACCLPDGGCILLPPDDCYQQGGAPQGPNMTCADVDCPQPEACCFSNGWCAVIPPDQCCQHDGVPLGPRSVCRGDFNENGIDDACELLGDLDGDGHVDLSDWRILADCLSGPAAPTGPECNAAHLNCDDKIDLGDVRLFQNAFGGQGK